MAGEIAKDSTQGYCWPLSHPFFKNGKCTRYAQILRAPRFNARGNQTAILLAKVFCHTSSLEDGTSFWNDVEAKEGDLARGWYVRGKKSQPNDRYYKLFRRIEKLAIHIPGNREGEGYPLEMELWQVEEVDNPDKTHLGDSHE